MNPSPKNLYVYSNEHQAFWRPNSCGYTTDILQAGLYTKEEADEICLDLRSHKEGNLSPEVARLESELSASDREKVEIKRDAERYRVIRNKPSRALLSAIQGHYGSFASAEEFDEEIDVVMGRIKETS